MCFAVLSWCIVSFGFVVCLVGMGVVLVGVLWGGCGGLRWWWVLWFDLWVRCLGCSG